MYTTNVSLIRANSPTLSIGGEEKRRPVTWDSFAHPRFPNNPTQPQTQGAKTRLVKLHWDALLSRGSITKKLPVGRAHLSGIVG